MIQIKQYKKINKINNKKNNSKIKIKNKIQNLLLKNKIIINNNINIKKYLINLNIKFKIKRYYHNHLINIIKDKHIKRKKYKAYNKQIQKRVLNIFINKYKKMSEIDIFKLWLKRKKIKKGIKNGTIPKRKKKIKKNKKKLKKKNKQLKNNKKYKKKKKKLKKKIGIIYLHCTYNNIIVTITNLKGKTKLILTSGKLELKNPNKLNYYAIEQSIKKIKKYLIKHKYKKIILYRKGIHFNTRKFVQKLQKRQIKIILIINNTKIPFNGCKKNKKRRI